MIPRHVPALALGTLALGVAEFSMMSILLPVADDLGVTVPEAGHFISAYAAGVCAGVLIMAAAARKMPLKTLLLIIVGIITLGNTLTVFVGSYHLMLFSRFIAGCLTAPTSAQRAYSARSLPNPAKPQETCV